VCQTFELNWKMFIWKTRIQIQRYKNNKSRFSKWTHRSIIHGL